MVRNSKVQNSIKNPPTQQQRKQYSKKHMYKH